MTWILPSLEVSRHESPEAYILCNCPFVFFLPACDFRVCRVSRTRCTISLVKYVQSTDEVFCFAGNLSDATVTVVSGNTQSNIRIGQRGVRVLRAYVGLTADGKQLPPAQGYWHGIEIIEGGVDCTIGGDSSSVVAVVSGARGHGISCIVPRLRVLSAFIGLSVSDPSARMFEFVGDLFLSGTRCSPLLSYPYQMLFKVFSTLLHSDSLHTPHVQYPSQYARSA